MKARNEIATLRLGIQAASAQMTNDEWAGPGASAQSGPFVISSFVIRHS
jgi:hypothetical protein